MHLQFEYCLSGATPKGILKGMKAMGVSELKILHVKSHLQVLLHPMYIGHKFLDEFIT